MGHHRQKRDRRKAIMWALLAWRKERRWRIAGSGSRIYRVFKELTGLGDPYRYLKFSRLYVSGTLFISKWKRCSICSNLMASDCFTAVKSSGRPSSWCRKCSADKASKYKARLYSDPIFADADRAKRRERLRRPDQRARLRANYERIKSIGRHLDHKYRRKARMAGGITAADARAFREAARPMVMCNWCGKRLAKEKAHMDHIVPLYRGGAHALYNLCWACSFCNVSKGPKMPNQWIRSGQLVLEMK